jgi:HEAT repeat protein
MYTAAERGEVISMKRGDRIFVRGVLTMASFVGVFGLLAPAARGQINSNQVRDRYERQTKGADLDDYVRRLNSDDSEKRLEATRSLAESKDAKAVEHLVQALGDPDPRIRARAIDGLGDLRATEATPVLIQHLFLRDTEETAKRRILAALGKIGDPRAASPILEFLQRSTDRETRGVAIFALGDIGAIETVPALEEMQENSDDPTLRRLSGQAIDKVRYQQTVRQNEAKQPQQTFLKEESPPSQ